MVIPSRHGGKPKATESYLEGGVSAVGEAAEAEWAPTETCLENGAGNLHLLPAPALLPPAQRHLEDTAERE